MDWDNPWRTFQQITRLCKDTGDRHHCTSHRLLHKRRNKRPELRHTRSSRFSSAFIIWIPLFTTLNHSSHTLFKYELAMEESIAYITHHAQQEKNTVRIVLSQEPGLSNWQPEEKQMIMRKTWTNRMNQLISLLNNNGKVLKIIKMLELTREQRCSTRVTETCESK